MARVGNEKRDSRFKWDALCGVYHDEPKPRHNGVLKAGDPSSSATKPVKIDFAKDWIDEADQKSMWIAGAASEADVKDNAGKVTRRPLKMVGWTGNAMMREVPVVALS